MEPVQRLIIGNNVYDANDDELEAEVTPYLNNLIKKQKTAKDGKAAIITATQNKTGKPITTNTYAEVVDKLEEIRFGTFNVQNLRFRSTFASYVPTYYQEIIGNKIVRFNNWETLTDVGSVAFLTRYPRTILHKPPNASDAMTLSIQVNLDFSSAVADSTPILSVSSENEAEDATVALTKVDNNTIKIKYVSNYDFAEAKVDTITVPDLSGYNYFGVDIICLANTDKIRINMYGGVRQENETSMSGYIPSNKVLLFSRTYNSKFNSYVLVNDAAIFLNICGNERQIESETTFAQTALHFQDYGIRLVDPYTTSVVGNTNFLDMEVTS